MQQRKRLLTDYLRDAVAEVTRVDATEIREDTGFFDLGMDSLMAVELRRRVEHAVGRELPATVDDATAKGISDLSHQVTEVAGLRGMARIDFLHKEGALYVNEVNTIPGSMAVYLWIDPPLQRRQLFEDMLAEAKAGQTRVFSTAGSDGTALRSAGTIASKLG